MIDVFGHVNNARFLELFEFARWQQGGEMRMWEKFGKAKIVPFVAACHIHYVNAIPPCTTVQIRTKLVQSNGKWWTMRQTMLSAKGDKIHASALFRIALIDKAPRKAGGQKGQVTVTGDEAIARMGFDPVQVSKRLEEEWTKEQGDDALSKATNIITETTELDEEWRKVLREQSKTLRDSARSTL